MITITVVRVRGGYVGLTFQDRWNLASLMDSRYKDVAYISACDSKSRIDAFRRRVKMMGFKLCVSRTTRKPVPITDTERDMFGVESTMAFYHDRVFMSA